MENGSHEQKFIACVRITKFDLGNGVGELHAALSGASGGRCNGQVLLASASIDSVAWPTGADQSGHFLQ